MAEQRIVVLAGPGAPSNILVHSLRSHFQLAGVIMEGPQDKWQLLKRRAARIGWMKTTGQVFFLLAVVPILKWTSAKRRNEILRSHGLNVGELPETGVTHVTSVNDESTIAALQGLRPDVVVVSGTRVIRHQLLSAVDVPFLNIHAGITPRYRGIHGLYWALMNDDAANAGVTVHLVDKGIDTGGVIAQAHVPHAPADNFTTYPLLQLAKGIELLTAALHDHADGKFNGHRREMDSRLWHHPTLLQYLTGRWRKGVK
ncbi:MAG: formyl transferase [Flavobacteriales bacterium]|nr:formyl transferase [Flavobacteriales bacterium]